MDEQGAQSRAHLVEGNRLVLIPDGRERLAALLDLIGTAQTRLDLYFYIFSKDECGEQVVDALIAARARGVAVTLLVDAFGTALTPSTLFEPLIGAGVRFGFFGNKRSTRYLIRNHQKMALADGRHGLVGGFNIEQGYFSGSDARDGWRDLALLVEGPLILDLQGWFDAMAEWTLGRQSFRALRRMVRDWKPGKGRTVWLMGGPTRHLNGWARRVKHDLQTGSRLDLVAAYFSPGWGMLRRMGLVAKRGEARLVTPMRSDNHTTIGAARHLYRRLLKAGVSIFEFRAQKLHSKLIVIDDVTYVGSANFDMRSLFLNVELVLRIDDAGFAKAARAEVDALVAQSRAIDGPMYRLMSGPFSKLRWWIDYLLVGVLDYTVTRRLNFRRGLRG